MKLSELGENAFLEELRSRFPPSERVPIGIGDDAAAVMVPEGEHVLLTVDALVEGTHFTQETLPPRFLGRKAVAASASDIAAMGGSGVGVLLSLVVSPELEVETLWQIVEGSAERADELGMALVGGNVSASTGAMVVDVTACGTTRGAHALRRDGARAGDGIYVSGKIGASVCGLKLLQQGAVLSPTGGLVVPESLRDGPLALAEDCIRAHMDPEPRLGLGEELSDRKIASACIDVSDGLGIDLARLCHASGVGARIEERSLPLHPGVLAWGRAWDRDPTVLALSGGEDYELLFTASNEKKVEALRSASDVPITKIGELRSPAEPIEPIEPIEIVRRDGTVEPVNTDGWDHFRHALRHAVRHE